MPTKKDDHEYPNEDKRENKKMRLSYRELHEEFSKTVDGVLRGAALLALSSVLFFGAAKMFRTGPREMEGIFYWILLTGTGALCLISFIVAWYFLIQPVIRLELLLNPGPARGDKGKIALFAITVLLILLFFAGSLGMLYVNLHPLLPNR